MDIRSLVGENFARIRREKGLMQERVEELSGFSQQYISGQKKGRRNSTIVTVCELENALSVDYLYLLKCTHPKGEN